MELMSVDVSAYFWTVIIVALSVVGVIEWLKNFVKPARRKMALTACGLTLVLALVGSPLVPAKATTVVFLFFGALAVGQICYQSLIQGLRNLIAAVLSRGINGPPGIHTDVSGKTG